MVWHEGGNDTNAAARPLQRRFGFVQTLCLWWPMSLPELRNDAYPIPPVAPRATPPVGCTPTAGGTVCPPVAAQPVAPPAAPPVAPPVAPPPPPVAASMAQPVAGPPIGGVGPIGGGAPVYIIVTHALGGLGGSGRVVSGGGIVGGVGPGPFIPRPSGGVGHIRPLIQYSG
ncbi:hypothetical protein ANCDUO_16851 [Ancylostoma duodenale]|uniref:Uncharacterized protein n=1 Tax=Ancylostoma duodenale TaxID=51022 RepID=A0A0C2CTA3_9BILA|nr:hypothetical protein ANCDUO_16851 [Ancylostoma duodenale]